MKVRNNSNKPIGIGILNLLPGQTEKLPEAYENHPVVRLLATKKFDKEHTFISLIVEKEKSSFKKASAKETSKKETSTEEAEKGAENGSKA